MKKKFKIHYQFPFSKPLQEDLKKGKYIDFLKFDSIAWILWKQSTSILTKSMAPHILKKIASSCSKKIFNLRKRQYYDVIRSHALLIKLMEGHLLDGSCPKVYILLFKTFNYYRKHKSFDRWIHEQKLQPIQILIRLTHHDYTTA